MIDLVAKGVRLRDSRIVRVVVSEGAAMFGLYAKIAKVLVLSHLANPLLESQIANAGFRIYARRRKTCSDQELDPNHVYSED